MEGSMILYVKTEEFNSRMNLIERQVYGQLSAAFLLLLQRVEAETWPMVPVEHGYLQDSFSYLLVSDLPRMSALMTYSSQDPEDGYDYASYQHENMNLHHDLPEWYTQWSMMDSGFFDDNEMYYPDDFAHPLWNFAEFDAFGSPRTPKDPQSHYMLKGTRKVRRYSDQLIGETVMVVL